MVLGTVACDDVPPTTNLGPGRKRKRQLTYARSILHDETRLRKYGMDAKECNNSRPLLDVGQSMEHHCLVLPFRELSCIHSIPCEILFTWRYIWRMRSFGRAVTDGLQLTGPKEMRCMSCTLDLPHAERWIA